MEKKGNSNQAVSQAPGAGYNFTFDKTFGQHILKNPLVVQ